MAGALVSHDPRWATLYEEAASGIRDALGSTALSIDHVGSTAIPGILAKPVIDILVLVARYDPEAAYRDPLAALGYECNHRDEAHVFFKGSIEGTPVNVHVVEKDAQDTPMMVIFRDYLRLHPDEARRYQDLKTRLAERHRDGDRYASAKSSYVSEVLHLARASTGGSLDAPAT
jgi:GrpB-like predicted nucleotidyltransferase (UPF0157 family)